MNLKVCFKKLSKGKIRLKFGSIDECDLKVVLWQKNVNFKMVLNLWEMAVRCDVLMTCVHINNRFCLLYCTQQHKQTMKPGQLWAVGGWMSQPSPQPARRFCMSRDCWRWRRRSSWSASRHCRWTWRWPGGSWPWFRPSRERWCCGCPTCSTTTHLLAVRPPSLRSILWIRKEMGPVASSKYLEYWLGWEGPRFWIGTHRLTLKLEPRGRMRWWWLCRWHL